MPLGPRSTSIANAGATLRRPTAAATAPAVTFLIACSFAIDSKGSTHASFPVILTRIRLSVLLSCRAHGLCCEVLAKTYLAIRSANYALSTSTICISMATTNKIPISSSYLKSTKSPARKSKAWLFASSRSSRSFLSLEQNHAFSIRALIGDLRLLVQAATEKPRLRVGRNSRPLAVRLGPAP